MLPVNLLLDLLRQFSFMVSYVSRGSSFPQPLPSKQEEVYIRRAMEGDKEAQNVLIERNLRLVAHVAKKYAGNGREMDDLVSIGTIGLIKAVNTYNVDKGTQLATYAARCIENAILS
jgi:RNA polymerase sporulation-specific sigma factor